MHFLSFGVLVCCRSLREKCGLRVEISKGIKDPWKCDRAHRATIKCTCARAHAGHNQAHDHVSPSTHHLSATPQEPWRPEYARAHRECDRAHSRWSGSSEPYFVLLFIAFFFCKPYIGRRHWEHNFDLVSFLSLTHISFC